MRQELPYSGPVAAFAEIVTPRTVHVPDLRAAAQGAGKRLSLFQIGEWLTADAALLGMLSLLLADDVSLPRGNSPQHSGCEC